MAQTMKRLGFGATVLIVLLLWFNSLREPYRQFRRDTITALVADVSDQARKIRPSIEISAAVFSAEISVRLRNGVSGSLLPRGLTSLPPANPS